MCENKKDIRTKDLKNNLQQKRKEVDDILDGGESAMCSNLRLVLSRIFSTKVNVTPTDGKE